MKVDQLNKTMAILSITALIALLSAPLVPANETEDAASPNIIVIYTDDLGYGDVSCYGATKVKTPNIDRLAEQGRMFTDAHSSSAVCTPSRYSLLTGEYGWRNPRELSNLAGNPEYVARLKKLRDRCDELRETVK